MANEPKINLALVGEMPENPVRGTVYMSPDASGNFVKVGVDGSVRTIFDGSDYVRKDESVWIPSYGEKSAALANERSYAAGVESVSHGSMTYARGLNSHAEGAGSADFPIHVYSEFRNNIIYGAGADLPLPYEEYIGYPVNYGEVCAIIIDAYYDRNKGIVFVLDKPLLDDGSDFTEKTEIYLFTGGVAAGEYSHTEGEGTVAVGDYSHAEGFETYAGRPNSHAEGFYAITYGEGAHAEGEDTKASGYSSHAEGTRTTASSDYSHVEGDSTMTLGDHSHAEGEGQEFSIIISGSAGTMHYEASGILRDVRRGDIVRYKPIQRATLILPYEKTNTDAGFRYAVITDVHTGKNNYIEVNETLDPSTDITDGSVFILQGVAKGIGSHSEGYYTNAVGEYSHTEGNYTRALSGYSHAEGDDTTVDGRYSHAEGTRTTAAGDYSHTEGEGTMASGSGSHAEGVSTSASSYYSHAEGSDTRAHGGCSHTEGENTITSGYGSHAEGYSTIALSEYSHAEGTVTEAFGNGSHAEGEGDRIPLDGVEFYGSQNTTVYTTSSAHGLLVNDILYIDYETDESNNRIAKVVSVDTSTQFTVDNTLNPDASLDASTEGTYVFYKLFGCAYGTHSHVEGSGTKTLGDYSHAEGRNTATSGDYSHAEGWYTSTSNRYEHAQGAYNMSHNYDTSFGNSGNTLNSIGIGVSDASRSNAIEVMQNGDVYVKGVGSYDGSNYVNASTLQEVVNSGGGGSVDSMTSITYANLKNLRDTSALIPGMQYRITDYECTTTQIDTSVAGNVFDIIVTADSSTELNENARAAHHSGDTYFQTCDLDAWELKYCLDNDTDRFAWADATNGKGIVYYMKDEWSNECPYDFKNILFTVSGNNYYTFDALVDSVHYDLSVAQTSLVCYGNIIEENYSAVNSTAYKLTLGRNIFRNTSLSSTCYSNILKNDCYSNTFGSSCRENIFGAHCYNNTFGGYCVRNSFGNGCYHNTFSDNYSGNIFGNSCYFNSFGNRCSSNSFGNDCYYNTFGSYCQSITVFDSVCFCYVTGGTNVSPVHNAQILNGTHGASASDKVNITFSKNKDYTQVAGLINGTDQRIWIAEDTVTGPTLSADGNIAIFDGVSGKVIKDSGLKISDIGAMTETTWSTLKLLKEHSGLVPGRMYRITDYNTTISEDLTDVSVAGHQFDIIVTALSETELDCHASAIQHAGDTYFSDCDLSKWQLWYDIENDTEKYSWALDGSSSANSGAKGSILSYAPEYIIGDKATTTTLDNAGYSHYLVFQGIETITLKEGDVECYVYGTSVQAAAFNRTKFFCQESPSEGSAIYSIDSKGTIYSDSYVIGVSDSTQPTDGTKIIAKSVTSETIAGILNKAGISPELEFNGRIVTYRGQNCYSYGSDAQYVALANNFKDISDIIVADGVSPVTPKKAPSDPGTYVIVLDDETTDLIAAVSQETVVVGGNSGGTGVIYRMIDEWGNDCPYDFKNIKFQRWAVTACSDCPSLVVDDLNNPYGYYYGAKWLNGNNVLDNATYGEDNGYFYTFALKDLESGEWFDYTVVAHLGLKDMEGIEVACSDNCLIEATDVYAYRKGERTKLLNNIVFFNCYTNLSDTSSAANFSRCNKNRLLGGCLLNTFGNDCYCNLSGNFFTSNTFADACRNNSFGNECSNNLFGTGCSDNSFGNECSNNSFGNVCGSNSFGNNCYYNSFGNGCRINSFGNSCYINSFKDICQYNSFGNNCHDNSFNNHCSNNSFANNCYYNSFGDGCLGNSFGNECDHNSFGIYCQFITIFNNVLYCYVIGGTNSAPVKNAQILNGAKGNSSSRLTISFTADQDYTQIAGLNSSGVLKIWTPADLID